MKCWICDHCGTTHSANRISAGKGVASPDGWASIGIQPVGRTKTFENMRADLCPDCVTQLQNFLTKQD